jgi:hypothetical protein
MVSAARTQNLNGIRGFHWNSFAMSLSSAMLRGRETSPSSSAPIVTLRRVVVHSAVDTVLEMREVVACKPSDGSSYEM